MVLRPGRNFGSRSWFNQCFGGSAETEFVLMDRLACKLSAFDMILAEDDILDGKTTPCKGFTASTMFAVDDSLHFGACSRFRMDGGFGL